MDKINSMFKKLTFDGEHQMKVVKMKPINHDCYNIVLQLPYPIDDIVPGVNFKFKMGGMKRKYTCILYPGNTDTIHFVIKIYRPCGEYPQGG